MNTNTFMKLWSTNTNIYTMSITATITTGRRKAG